jgi:hypothetical protein
VGVVTIGSPGGDEVNWTVDNGRHWISTDAISSQDDIDGHGKMLFWSSGASLYQVRPWPPGRQQLKCGRLVAGNGADICVHPRYPLRSTRVAAIPNGENYELSAVPGGVVGLVRRRQRDDASLPLFRLLVRRNNTTVVFDLPRLTQEQEQEVALTADNLVVSWPRITVIGHGFLHPSAKAVIVAVWSSPDGGQTWTVTPGG